MREAGYGDLSSLFFGLFWFKMGGKAAGLKKNIKCPAHA